LEAVEHERRVARDEGTPDRVDQRHRIAGRPHREVHVPGVGRQRNVVAGRHGVVGHVQPEVGDDTHDLRPRAWSLWTDGAKALADRRRLAEESPGKGLIHDRHRPGALDIVGGHQPAAHPQPCVECGEKPLRDLDSRRRGWPTIRAAGRRLDLHR
jgi:hypothetical protein